MLREKTLILKTIFQLDFRVFRHLLQRFCNFNLLPVVGNDQGIDVKVFLDQYLYQGRGQVPNHDQDLSQLKFTYLYLLWSGMVWSVLALSIRF